MWAFGQEQSLIAAGQDKHARYLKEAEMVRLVQAVSWRRRAATTLRNWADGLEPVSESWQPTLRSVH